jgi:hypothetical protein
MTQVYPLPTLDPISGEPLYISELSSVSTGISIRGKFALPRFSQLNADQIQFLEVFLRNRGMLNGVEKELGISYPTARLRLDAVLTALGLRETEESVVETPISASHILDRLENGEIDSAEAKRLLSHSA